MAGNNKHMFMRDSWKKLIISFLISTPVAAAVYFWFLQPANFISKRYIAAAILLWVLLATGILFLLRRIKQKIASFDKKIFFYTMLLCIITAFLLGYFIIGIENTPYNLFILPKHNLVIENASENENDVIELVDLHSGLGYESFSKFIIDGSWTRVENSLIAQGTQKASLHYEGWLVEKPVLGFQAQPNGGRVNIYWDGQLEQVSLYSSLPYEKQISKTIENPISNKLPVLITGILSIAIALFSLILLLAETSISLIVSVSFLISYLSFFIYPVFLNSAHVMQFFPYVPVGNPIGLDLYSILQKVTQLLSSPTYAHNLPYPPFLYIFFAPLTILDRYTAYGIFTILSILCYFFITLIFPIRASKKKVIPSLLMLILITGLFSFGFQFGIERGQFDLITMFFCFLAIFIFHHHKKYRFWAYILFTMSIQLKLYPAIFIFMFIDDWSDWKGNIIRFFSLGAASLCALFILGFNTFRNFLNSITNFAGNPFLSVKNHSIQSFTRHPAEFRPLGVIFKNPNSVEIIILIIVLICFLLILYQAYRQKYAGINPYLLLACTLGALLIPSTSHDYTLSFLAAPIAILFTDRKLINIAAEWKKPFFTQLLLYFSIAYSSTLFSYTNKPLSIQNNFPALMVMLAILTFFSFATNLDSTIKHDKS